MKNTITKFTIILAAVAAMVATAAASQKVVQPAPAAKGTWQLIGSTQANHSADHDGIVVKGPFDNFRRVKFKVTNAPLNMQKMVITYDNGSPENIDVRQSIPQGGESRQIDLKGIGSRRIRRIDFWYDTKGLLNGKANVTVFGMK